MWNNNITFPLTTITQKHEQKKNLVFVNLSQIKKTIFFISKKINK